MPCANVNRLGCVCVASAVMSCGYARRALWGDARVRGTAKNAGNLREAFRTALLIVYVHRWSSWLFERKNCLRCGQDGWRQRYMFSVERSHLQSLLLRFRNVSVIQSSQQVSKHWRYNIDPTCCFQRLVHPIWHTRETKSLTTYRYWVIHASSTHTPVQKGYHLKLTLTCCWYLIVEYKCFGKKRLSSYRPIC